MDWKLFFCRYRDVDDYASRFTSLLNNFITTNTKYVLILRRQRLPRHTIQLLHKKKRAWLDAKCSKDYNAYNAAWSTARTAIRSHRLYIKSRLIYSNNRNAFFSYIYNKINNVNSQICLTINYKPMSDKEATNVFLHEFSGNFSAASDVNVCVYGHPPKAAYFQSSCMGH